MRRAPRGVLLRSRPVLQRGNLEAEQRAVLLPRVEPAVGDAHVVFIEGDVPIMVGEPRKEVLPQMLEWLDAEWDFPNHSDCTPDSAIIGTVDDCVEQLQAHIDAGVQKLIFVPYKYEAEQVDIIAKEIIPRLRK